MKLLPTLLMTFAVLTTQATWAGAGHDHSAYDDHAAHGHLHDNSKGNYSGTAYSMSCDH
jgi:hypothetical protein